jgi:penicillin V acylase-like amidase (Ntn superfamily)
MGAIGLPGDFSSASRFVRAFFVKENSVFFDDEMTNVTQFFHIMNSVAMPVYRSHRHCHIQIIYRVHPAEAFR